MKIASRSHNETGIELAVGERQKRRLSGTAVPVGVIAACSQSNRLSECGTLGGPESARQAVSLS
jgi:hypothetical protein